MFDLLCIVGPTASGKTNLAVRLAAAFGKGSENINDKLITSQKELNTE